MQSTLILYLFDLKNVSEEDIVELEELLNTEQQKKCNAINKRKKKEFILSRSLLTFAVKNALGSEDLVLDIQERPQLPPFVALAKQHDIQFSISHSKYMLGIAIGRGKQAIGFDIQAIKDYSKDVNLSKNGIESARYFCSESQVSNLKNYLNDRALFSRHYTQIWAKKEAYLKSLQLGINHELLKTTDFIEANNQQGFLQSSTLENSHEDIFALAVYCEKPYSIVCHSLIINQLKFCIQEPKFELDWKTLNVIN